MFCVAQPYNEALGVCVECKTLVPPSHSRPSERLDRLVSMMTGMEVNILGDSGYKQHYQVTMLEQYYKVKPYQYLS